MPPFSVLRLVVKHPGVELNNRLALVVEAYLNGEMRSAAQVTEKLCCNIDA